MLQGLLRRAPGRFDVRPQWLRSERAMSMTALAVAAVGLGLSLLVAVLGS